MPVASLLLAVSGVGGGGGGGVASLAYDVPSRLLYPPVPRAETAQICSHIPRAMGVGSGTVEVRPGPATHTSASPDGSRGPRTTYTPAPRPRPRRPRTTAAAWRPRPRPRPPGNARASSVCGRPPSTGRTPAERCAALAWAWC